MLCRVRIMCHSCLAGLARRMVMTAVTGMLGISVARRMYVVGLLLRVAAALLTAVNVCGMTCRVRLSRLVRDSHSSSHHSLVLS